MNKANKHFMCFINKVVVAIAFISLLSGCGSGSAEKETINPPPGASYAPDAGLNADSNGKSELFFESMARSKGLFHTWDLVDLDAEGIIESTFNASGGIAIGDFDQDGKVDLFITGGNKSASKLYKKQNDGTYVDVAEQAGVQLTGLYSGPGFADTDNDGDLDLFVGGMGSTSSKLFINQGDGTFTEGVAPAITKEYTLSSSFGDFNNDGNLDLALSHYASSLSNDSEHLWMNTGNNQFESVSTDSGIMNSDLNGEYNFRSIDLSFTPNFADIDNDGQIDLLMASDYNTSVYLRNNGDGYFEDKSTSLNLKQQDLQGMGASIADIDNDGDLDWFVTNIIELEERTGSITISGNKLFKNNGDGSFTDVSYSSNIYNGGWGWASCIADFNNDGLPDVFNTNGWSLASSDSGKYESHDKDTIKLFLATESGIFTENNVDLGLTDKGQGRAVVCFDQDNDGDIDILLSNHDTNDNALIFYQNTGNTGNHLSIELRTTGKNTFAIGARVYVKDASREQMKEVNINSNFTSQTPYQLHFGLGEITLVEQIRILWPNGEEQIITDIEVNQSLLIEQQITQ